MGCFHHSSPCASVLWSFLNNYEDIIMGSHKEGGASTFWSYILNLPLSSNSMISWKFCYLLHKLLRDGHRNAVADSYRRCRNVKDMGVLWGNLHDRYGHIVALSTKFLCLKMEFHAKHKVIPGNLEASDDTLEREAGTDMNKVILPGLSFNVVSMLLFFSSKVLRQLDANGAKSTTAAGQCRLTPLIPLILDCSFLYHFSVRLMFKLHSRIPPDALLGHRERFRDLFMSLTQFFDRAKETEFFKSIIQIPDLPDAPPNFLRAAALAEYKKPVVVMPNEERHEEEEEEVETQPEFREYYLLNQMTAPDTSLEQRETESESMRRELEVLKPELQLIRIEAQRCVTELKGQVNRLEAEVEEQRTHKQMAMVENEHLRMEVEALRCTNVANVGAHIGFKEADAQAAELRFTQLKERHAELITSHADLMKKVHCTIAVVSVTPKMFLHCPGDSQMRGSAPPDSNRFCLESFHVCLAQKLQDEQFCLLQCAVVEAEGIILDAVAKVDDPIHVRCISSPDYLVNRAEITLSSIDKMQQSHVVYLGNRHDASGLLRAVTQFSHLAADTIVNGAATSHSAPTDIADRLTDSCRDCANHCLQYLKDLKLQASLQRADPSVIRYTVQRLLSLGQDLHPKGQDVLKEELGSMVDREMIATSTAIEEAVLRMDEILNQAKRDMTDQNCISISIYNSIQFNFICIGAASVTDFYAKNSRWTEGLISASKAVGWGATQLVDSADLVVGENGTYEELIACSHEIAASTAQLVAASKVKADRNNKKLNTLQQASRHVNDMAAVVVTSTKHGQRRFSDQGTMDFSGMSLIKLKKEEMEAQVKVLQLECQLEQERVRLGECFCPKLLTV
uniref:I/LWEQ domain-containing protein n=1 Tax=Scophthalmus maximus TaxID=52904 RepID=A0A8D3CRY2_SCOMX